MNQVAFPGVLGSLFLAVAVVNASAADPKPRLQKSRGKVVEITDGDTFTLQVDKTKQRIALAGVDCPEDGQPFSNEAKQALSGKILGKTVETVWRERDRYGRILGVVRLGGECVNTQLVREGWAWHYRAYSDSKSLTRAESEARKAKRGLWAQRNPVPPWQWRRIQDEAKNKPNVGRNAPRQQPANGRQAQNGKQQPQPSHSYWLTASSGVRHNGTCRYYRKSKGRLCGPNDGRACKICGG